MLGALACFCPAVTTSAITTGGTPMPVTSIAVKQARGWAPERRVGSDLRGARLEIVRGVGIICRRCRRAAPQSQPRFAACPQQHGNVQRTCSCMFRAQPPFLQPRAIYTRRVVQKAVDAVYRDGLAASPPAATR